MSEGHLSARAPVDLCKVSADLQRERDAVQTCDDSSSVGHSGCCSSEPNPRAP